jgi:hypothetical protein
MLKRLGGFAFLYLILVYLVLPVQAQTSASASLSSPNLDNFPLIQAYLDVRDPQGKFIHGLTRNDVSIVENNQLLPVASLEELHPGAQVVVALNPGSSFAVRNSQGKTRAELILQGLADWADNRRGSTIDDLSLLITNLGETTHVSDLGKFQAALNLGNIDLRDALPTIDTLSRAIDIASDAPPRPGMGRSVILITAPMEEQTDISTESLIARAKERGVRIYTYLVAPPGAFIPNTEKQLNDLASQTGGQFFAYLDDQPLVDTEDVIEGQRSIYILTYQSQIRSSGTYQIAAQVRTPSGEVTSPLVAFEITLQAPDPAFISPPLEIQRQPPTTESDQSITDIPIPEYLPAEQELQILVAFPDERVRPITRTSLYIDGVLAAENTSPPFDRFIWDISDYITSGQHTLRVEAQDSLGMLGSSIDKIVQVNVATPQRNPWSWVYRNAPALSILAAVVAGAVLLLVLVLGGRIRPHRAEVKTTPRRRSDPVTQPVVVKTELPSRPRPTWANRIHWPQRHIAPKAYAFLNRISDEVASFSSTPIPITADEVTVGSDPSLSTLVLADPSVDGLHARILRQEDGIFRLIDEGSVAGTWINYSPLSREGTKLEHGDLVHIGRVGFRFTLRQPGKVRKPEVYLADGKTNITLTKDLSEPKEEPPQ